jgi:iron complex outermembrane receptor protein
MRRISSGAGSLSVCLGVGLITASMPSFSDNEPAAEGSEPSPELTQIVVTARRRTEALEDVPVAVTAFTQEALTARSITSAFDLNRAVPGLTVDADSGNSGLPAFSIRGKGQNYGSAAGSVETYFAEVPLSAPFQMPTLPPQFFDLQSLQLLKGPQGTLFGRSTTGGAVVIVPQAPTDQFGGYARLQGGTYGDFQAEGAVNLPLDADKVDLRLAGFEWQRNGYMHTNAGVIDAATGRVLPAQTYDNQNVTEFRGTLRVRPAEGLENSTLLTFHSDGNRATAGAGLNTIGLGAPNGLGAFYTPGYGTRYSDLDLDLSRPHSRVWAVINTTSYELVEDLTLKNIFGYIDASGYTDQPQDSDGTGVAAIAIDGQTVPRPLKNRQTTDELQLQGQSFNRRLQWIVGGLIDRTREPWRLTDINIFQWTQQFGHSVTGFVQNTINSYGAYASGTLKITDRINLSAGYRHTWDDVMYGTAEQAGFGTIPGVGGIVISPLTYYQQKAQGNTYNVSLDYHPVEGLMVYGGYRRGYKRGGFNPSQTDPKLSSFLPETVDDYSVGLKTNFKFGDVEGQFNIEGFYDLYKGMQESYLAVSATGLSTVTTNVPKTTFRGFDMDFMLRPTAWLTLSGNYSLIDAYITDWPDTTLPGSTLNLALNPVPYVSRNKLTFTPKLHGELPNGLGELVLAPSVNYQDRFYTGALVRVLPAGEAIVLGQFDTVAHGGGLNPGYTTIDARAEWNHIEGSAFDADFNVTNLTDKVFFLGNTGNTLNIGGQGAALGPPRMFSVELLYKF